MTEDVLYLLWIGGCMGFALGMLTTYVIFREVLFRKKPKKEEPPITSAMVLIWDKSDGEASVVFELHTIPDTKPGEPLMHNSHILAHAMVDSVTRRDPKEWRN